MDGKSRDVNLDDSFNRKIDQKLIDKLRKRLSAPRMGIPVDRPQMPDIQN